MPQEAEEENQQRDRGVVHAEVVEVSLDAVRGFADGGGAGKRGRRGAEELPPRAARGEE